MVNKIALVAGLAALTEQALAVGSHRKAHMELERRALAAEARVAELEARQVHTEWTYVTTTIYGPPQPAQPTQQVNVEQPPVASKENKPKGQQNQANNGNIGNDVNNAYQPPAAQPESTQDEAADDKDEGSKTSSGSSNNNGGSSPFGCKRGFAFDSTRDANTYKADCPTCCWGHDWASIDNIGKHDFEGKALEPEPFPHAKGFDFVPTCWGKPEDIRDFPAIAKKAIANGAKALFSFNEPDIAAQANMQPADAARLHQQVFGGLKDAGALIAAPSVSNSGEAGQGLEWLEQWYSDCNGNCHFDFCNLHWYTDPGSEDTLIKHLDKAKNTTVCGDKPLWLTEFNLNGNDQTAISKFIADYVPQLDDREDVQAYAFFMASKDHLLDGSGSGPSVYGKTYATA